MDPDPVDHEVTVPQPGTPDVPDPGTSRESRGEDLLVALRRITRAIDLHSRVLQRDHQLTGPQLLVLRTIQRHGETTSGMVAREVSLSQPTLTGILSRLEAKGLLTRRRNDEDRRKVMVRTTPAADEMIALAPALLQESFLQQYANLADWEQTQILSSFQRVVAMMDADTLDAAPVLTTGPIDPSPPTPDRP